MKGLKIQRIKVGITQTELAQATGIHVRCIRSYEQGKRRPRPATIELLTKFFDCSPSDLL